MTFREISFIKPLFHNGAKWPMKKIFNKGRNTSESNGNSSICLLAQDEFLRIFALQTLPILQIARARGILWLLSPGCIALYDNLDAFFTLAGNFSSLS